MSHLRRDCIAAVFYSIGWLFLLDTSTQAIVYFVATDGDDQHTATEAQQISTPWKTLNHAAWNVSPGDQVIVRGGTYHEEVVMRSDGVTWKAFPGETPIVDGSVALGTLQPLQDANDFLDPNGVTIAGRFAGNVNWEDLYKVTFPVYDTSLSTYYMYRTMILEGGQLMAPSSLPQQSGNLYDDHLTYIPIDPNCFGATAFLTTSGRGEPNDFWNGAVIKIYLRNYRNVTVARYITDWDHTTQRFTFSTPLPATLSSGDSYKLENHWGCLTRPGEIYVPQTAIDGSFTVYIWPESDDDLTDFRIAKHDCGWYFYDGNDDDLTIDGFTIQNFCGSNVPTSFAIGRPAASLNTMNNCRIRNCTIRNIEGRMAIILGAPNGVIVDNCFIDNARTEWGIFARGLSMNRGTDVIIQNCSVLHCRGTNYKMTETDYGQIRNCFIGESSTHGDGIAIYENCSHIGVFHCQAVNSAIALAYQGVTHLYVIGNECQTYWYSMAHWSDSTGGDMVFLNNTMALAPGGADLISPAGFQLATDLTPGNYVVKNNIFWSTAASIPSSYTVPPNSFDKGHNCFLQNREHWAPDTGSFVCTSTGELFTDWSNPTLRDLTIKDPNAAIYQAGVNVDEVLARVEAVFLSRGPLYQYHLDVDRNGTLWADNPSIGADEFPAYNGIMNRVYNQEKNRSYAAIQQAIMDANDFEQIVVYPGTYAESINFMGKSITIRSTDPNDWRIVEATIIDPGGLGRAVTFNSREDANSILSGFTITGGAAVGTGNDSGGGICCDHASPTIQNCVVKNSYAERHGGGMYAIGSSVHISSCIFTENQSSDSGGGLFIDANSVANVTGCIFTENLSLQSGGGMVNGPNSISTTVGCVFSDNLSNEDGGGMVNDANSLATIINCTFTGNTALRCGGGMSNSFSEPNVSNCIFWDDIAFLEGPEIYNELSVPIFHHCNIAGSGGSGSWKTQIGSDQGGNIDADPLFVDAGSATVDHFQLSEGSPCIDAGENRWVPPTMNTDAAGRFRFVDDALTTDIGSEPWPVIDIGAFEYACPCNLDLSAGITLADFTLFSQNWMEEDCNLCGGADFTGDHKVSINDLVLLIANWLCGT